jgi:hypothetical protein
MDSSGAAACLGTSTVTSAVTGTIGDLIDCTGANDSDTVLAVLLGYLLRHVTSAYFT